MADLETQLRDALADSYRIDRKIGSGGMATVWLAHDVKHDRQVALKVLHPELAAVMGADRFLGEIRTTANLQHPHILPLFDSGTVSGTPGGDGGPGYRYLYYVMPYVEGESLRERLTREKQLPVEESVRIGRAVAGALAYAHDKGIIHRDIKPENILLQGDQPMVADFGIALAVSAAGGGRLTETGLSLGTPYYMSPEQASADRDLTPAADVYSLGAVLFEMLAGEPPHTGTSAQAVLARILTHAPARLGTQRNVPPHVDAVVARALQRLPADRFETAAEFIQALDNPGYRYGDEAALAAASSAQASRWRTLALAGAGLAVVAAALAAWGWLRQPPPEPVTRLALEVPDLGFARAYPWEISGDGRYVVVGPPFGGNAHLLSLADFTTRPLDVAATSVSFSRDGTRYTANGGSGRLVAWLLTGGPGTTIAEGARPANSVWDDRDRVWFITGGNTSLSRVPGTGGAVESLMPLDSTWNWFVGTVLPGGDRALGHRLRGFDGTTADLVVYDLQGDTVRVLGPGVGPRLAGKGTLVYWVPGSDSPGVGALMGVGFDAGQAVLTGAPVPLVENVGGTGADWYGGVSATGSLVYGATTTTFGADVVLVGRAGDRRRLPGLDSGVWMAPRVSPDSRLLAVREAALGNVRRGTQGDIWVYTLPNGPVSRRTFGGTGVDRSNPAWSPDGARILFTRRDTSGAALYAVPADGSTPEQSLGRLGAQNNTFSTQFAVSPDGQAVVHTGSGGLWLRKLDDTASTMLIEGQGAAPTTPAVSPDGRWIAYMSRESGRAEIYVQSFPVPGAKYQVSLDGGVAPFWSRSGRSIFYDVSGELFEARVNPGPPFEVLTRNRVMDLGQQLRLTDVLPGDSVFAGYTFRTGDMRTMLVLNFLEEIKARLAR